MKKQDYQDLLVRSIYGELSADEQRFLESYLSTHPALKKEQRELQRLRAVLYSTAADVDVDGLLAEARQELRRAARRERNAEHFAHRIMHSIREFVSPKFAVASTAAILIGIAIGYYSFSPRHDRQDIAVLPVSGEASTKGSMEISNVRMIETGNGMVEIEFDAVAPVTMKGSIDDPEIQKVLTHALLNESNAGIRLASVTTIGDQIAKMPNSDPAVRTALITTVKSDENPGVRREALRVLMQFDYDKEIRDALLHILSHDRNTGLRVAAINALETATLDGGTFDASSIAVLKQRMESENNTYIRNRAATLIKEIYQ